MTIPLRDEAWRAPVASSKELWSGPIFSVRRDRIRFAGSELTRDVAAHLDAVAIVALDDAHRVLLIRQYRHPVGRIEWELPAGLVDVPGENFVQAARRELIEETDHDADEFSVLLQHYTSPGFTDEHLTTFLAQGVHLVPPEQRHTRSEEESQIEVRWVPLTEAVEAALAGDVQNMTTIAGLLAAERRLPPDSSRNPSYTP
ncbi:MAG: NUDIX domain-containing protein [Nostocoides sp.]